MEDDLNRRRPQRNTTLMKDDLNGRLPQWKTISMEDNLNGRLDKGKPTSIEEHINGSQPQWKPYKKHMTLACLASQFRTELGPAQPQLVLLYCCSALSKLNTTPHHHTTRTQTFRPVPSIVGH